MSNRISDLVSKFNTTELVYNPTWFETIFDWIIDGPAKRQELENKRLFQERLDKFKLSVRIYD